MCIFVYNIKILVSGFSPALLKALLAGTTMTPESMMYDVIGADRYDVVTV